MVNIEKDEYVQQAASYPKLMQYDDDNLVYMVREGEGLNLNNGMYMANRNMAELVDFNGSVKLQNK
tara:strand:- start:1177 stop:1374 length:198 start_codon:yes stop_codon:yes gene_type:complete